MKALEGLLAESKLPEGDPAGRGVSLDPGIPGTSSTGYVYLVTNTVNGKKYVGCTRVTVSRRWIQHRSAAKNGSPFALHQAIRKYGFNKFQMH